MHKVKLAAASAKKTNARNKRRGIARTTSAMDELPDEEWARLQRLVAARAARTAPARAGPRGGGAAPRLLRRGGVAGRCARHR